MSGERKQVSGPGAEPGRVGAGAAAYTESGAMLGLVRHRPRDPRGRVTTSWPCDQCVQAAERTVSSSNTECCCLWRPRGRGAGLRAAIERLSSMEVLSKEEHCHRGLGVSPCRQKITFVTSDWKMFPRQTHQHTQMSFSAIVPAASGTPSREMFEIRVRRLCVVSAVESF